MSAKEKRIKAFEKRLNRFTIPLGCWADDPLPDVLNAVAIKIRRLVDSEEVLEFYIGRSSNPDKRNATAHGADVVRPFFQTNGYILVQEAEEDLIGRFYKKHPKNNNESEKSVGDLGDPPYFVYVCFWIR